MDSTYGPPKTHQQRTVVLPEPVKETLPALDTAGVGRVTTIKDLRHTCASLMHAAARSAKEIKEQLGHSPNAMTFDTYTHLFDEGRDEAAEAMAMQFTRSLRAK